MMYNCLALPFISTKLEGIIEASHWMPNSVFDRGKELWALQKPWGPGPGN